MNNIKYLVLSVFLMVSCGQNVNNEEIEKNNMSPEKAEAITDGVFIHITEGYDSPHRVLMPLKMASIMAEDRDVIVYMDIHAVDLLVKDAPDLTMDGFESCQTYLKILGDMEIGVYACPTCLSVAGHEQEDLRPGIQIAQKDKFFDFTEGRIITLDY